MESPNEFPLGSMAYVRKYFNDIINFTNVMKKSEPTHKIANHMIKDRDCVVFMLLGHYYCTHDITHL
jgi:hypothetical protein